MIKAVIFDMDGLLVDTEPYWQETEREVFRELGIEITEAMQVSTFGLRTDEQIRYWQHHQPWEGKTVAEVEERYNTVMLDYFRNEAGLMEGAEEAIRFFHSKGLPLAIASSSNMELINAFLDRFEFHRYFRVIYSAEFEEYGKPHPGVYLETARRLGVEPIHCLALEDSFHGMIAAKAARMKTIVIPEHPEQRFGASDCMLESLTELDEKIFQTIDQTK